MVNQMLPPMQSPYVQQQQRPGFGQMLANNSNMLTAMGLGLLSGRGPEGYRNAMLGAFQGSQMDRQARERREEKQKTANQLNATAQWLINSRGVDPMEVEQHQEMGTLANLAAQHMKPPPKPPSSFQEFQLAQDNEAYAQHLADNSGGVSITMPPQEKEYDKARGKQFAELAGNIDQSAMAAHGRIGMLDHMEQLLSNPAVYQGAGGEANLALRKAAGSLGFDMEGVSDAEAARAIGNRMALELRNPSGGAGMPGAMSDKDREFLTSSVPGLTKTREGNMRLIEYSKRIAQRDLEVQQLAQDYVQRNGRLDSGFSAELRAFSDANPLFPEAKNKVEDLGANSIPDGLGEYMTPEERALFQ